MNAFRAAVLEALQDGPKTDRELQDYLMQRLGRSKRVQVSGALGMCLVSLYLSGVAWQGPEAEHAAMLAGSDGGDGKWRLRRAVPLASQH